MSLSTIPIHIVAPGTIVFVRSDVNTVKRGVITSVNFSKDGLTYIMSGNVYSPERLFETSEQAFKS